MGFSGWLMYSMLKLVSPKLSLFVLEEISCVQVWQSSMRGEGCRQASIWKFQSNGGKAVKFVLEYACTNHSQEESYDPTKIHQNCGGAVDTMRPGILMEVSIT